MKKNRQSQRGVTTVEFAILGTVLLLLVLGAIELGRILFTLNVLQESARRGARVAAVCQVGNAGVVNATKLLPEVGDANITVRTLDSAGNVTTDYAQIAFVQVTVSGYSMPLGIPIVSFDRFDAPPFTSTLPRESLGIPRAGAPPACY